MASSITSPDHAGSRFKSQLRDLLLSDWQSGGSPEGKEGNTESETIERELQGIVDVGAFDDLHAEDERVNMLKMQVDLLADEVERKENKLLEVRESFRLQLAEWEKDLKREQLNRKVYNENLRKLEMENARLREDLREANDRIEALVSHISEERAKSETQDILNDVQTAMRSLQLNNKEPKLMASPRSTPHNPSTPKPSNHHNFLYSVTNPGSPIRQNGGNDSPRGTILRPESPISLVNISPRSNPHKSPAASPNHSFSTSQDQKASFSEPISVKPSKSALEMLQEFRREKKLQRQAKTQTKTFQEMHDSEEDDDDEETYTYLINNDSTGSDSDWLDQRNPYKPAQNHGKVAPEKAIDSKTSPQTLEDELWAKELQAQKRYKQLLLTRKTGPPNSCSPDSKLLELWDKLNVAYTKREQILIDLDKLDARGKTKLILEQMENLQTKRDTLKLSGLSSQVQLLEQLYSNEDAARQNLSLQTKLHKSGKKNEQRIFEIIKERKRTERLVKHAILKWQKTHRQQFYFRGFPYLTILDRRHHEAEQRDFARLARRVHLSF